jgi:hypothetical protein
MMITLGKPCISFYGRNHSITPWCIHDFVFFKKKDKELATSTVTYYVLLTIIKFRKFENCHVLFKRGINSAE